MATRFWLTSSAPPYTPTTRRGSWAVATGEDVQYLGRKPAGSAGSSTINVGSTAANRDVLLHRSISDGAVKAGTLSGTVQWVIGAKESNAACNAFFHLHIYVTSGDTDTPRGTLLTDSIGATEFGTTAVGATEGSKTLSAVNVQVGDRIVVEVGYRASAGATTQNATINYGNTGTTDLTNGSASVTSAPGWIEFSGADGLFTKSFSLLTDQFPTSIDSKWTASAGVSVVSGRARINCTTATPNMFTATAYEIQGSTLAFKVPTVPVAGGGSTVTCSAYLMPSAGSTTNLEFEYSPNTGNLVLRNSVGGTDASPTTLTYNSSTHLWWRFRETAGSILMETSPDNSTWTTRRTISTPSQWMLQGSLVAYFEASRASGTADFAEIDDINPPTGQTAAVGVSSETGTAQAIGKAKTNTPAIASATDTAQPLARVKRLTLGLATENATGQSVAGRAKTKALTLAVEASTAPPLGKVLALHQGAETDTVMPVGQVKRVLLGTAFETSAGQAAPGMKTRPLPTAATADGAQPLTLVRGAQLSPAVSTETARPIPAAKTAPLTPAGQTSTAQPINATKRAPVAPAAAAETARPLTVTRTYPLPPAAETATAQLLPPHKQLALGAAAEESAAGMLTNGLARALDRTTTVDTAQPLTAAKNTPLTAATGTEAAQPLTATRHYPASTPTATEQSQPLAARKTIPLNPAFDYGTTPPLGTSKTRTLTHAADYATAQPLTHGTGQAITPASSTETAQPLHVTKTRLLSAAVCTDTAIPLTTPDTNIAHGLRLTGRPYTAWTSHPTASPWTASLANTPWAADATTSPWTCRTHIGGDVNSLSTEYHEVPVAWTRGDPTTHTVEMAVIPVGHEPDTADWHPATWDTTTDGQTVAKLLVGPDGGALAPTPGTYRDWVSVDAPPEHPVLFTPPFEIS